MKLDLQNNGRKFGKLDISQKFTNFMDMFTLPIITQNCRYTRFQES